MRRSYRLLGLVVAGLIFSPVVLGWTKSLYITPKYTNIKVRLIARERPLPITTFGQNIDSYVVELVAKKGEPQLARLSFRFLHHEPTIPDELFDYRAVHEFRASRDRSCDTTTAATDIVSVGANAPQLQKDKDRQLPCYVVTPKDYRGTDHRK